MDEMSVNKNNIVVFSHSFLSHLKPLNRTIKILKTEGFEVIIWGDKFSEKFIEKELCCEFLLYPVGYNENRFYDEIKNEENLLNNHIRVADYNSAMKCILRIGSLRAIYVDKTVMKVMEEKVSQYNPALIMRDACDVYGSEISKTLHVPCVGYITNNLYTKEYLNSNSSVLNPVFGNFIEFKKYLDNKYILNYYEEFLKESIDICSEKSIPYVNPLSQFDPNEKYNLVFSCSQLQPQIFKKTEQIYLTSSLFFDEDRFKTESRINSELKEFIHLHKKNCIYISAGSFITLSTEIYIKLIRELRKHNFVAIISSGKQHSELKEKIKENRLEDFTYTAEFLPQMNVLENVKFFITLGGYNSVLESIHYKVPMIVFPLSAEQRLNGIIIEEKGIGITLYKERGFRYSFREAIIDMVRNYDFYYKNIFAMSKQIENIDFKKEEMAIKRLLNNVLCKK